MLGGGLSLKKEKVQEFEKLHLWNASSSHWALSGCVCESWCQIVSFNLQIQYSTFVHVSCRHFTSVDFI